MSIRRNTLTAAGKSPSTEIMKKVYNRAVANGGVTQDFSVTVQSIRELSVKLGYNVLNDAVFLYIPSSYAESINFAQVKNTGNDFAFTRASIARIVNKQGIIDESCYNRLINSATGTTQSITVTADSYNLSFFGTGSYTLSGVATGVFSGTGASVRVSFPITCTSGTLTLTVSGTITNVQFNLGGLRDYLKTTNRNGVPKIDYFLGTGKPSLLIEPQRTNLLLNSITGTTQGVTVTAQVYTLSFYGTGSYTLSGTSTGTLTGTGVNNLVTLTFTPTAGTLTLTVSGSITYVQLEAGPNATSRIVTTGATAARSAETSFVDLLNNNLFNQTNFTLYWECYIYNGNPGNKTLVLSDTSIATGNTYQIGWYEKAKTFYSINTVTTVGASQVDNAYYKLVAQYNNGTLKFYNNGILMNTYAVPVFNYRYLVLNNGGSTFATQKIALFNRTLSDAECLNLTT